MGKINAHIRMIEIRNANGDFAISLGSAPWLEYTHLRLMIQDEAQKHPIIIGRKTFEDVGCLSNNRHFVLSRKAYKPAQTNAVTVRDFGQALLLADNVAKSGVILIIGGFSLLERLRPPMIDEVWSFQVFNDKQFVRTDYLYEPDKPGQMLVHAG
jgi:dihydrofolate reductase